MNKFDPGSTELHRTIMKYYNKIYLNDELSIIIRPTHPAFFNPITEIGIREIIADVPNKFTKDLAAIIVLAGSRKQEKVFQSLFAYGRYTENVIIIHPFPRKFMGINFMKLPKPSVLNDYKRAGATITFEDNQWWIRFDEDSLRHFYSRDVLMHEIGHHYDARNFRSKSGKKAENFAEWFATEYGYKPWFREETPGSLGP